MLIDLRISTTRHRRTSSMRHLLQYRHLKRLQSLLQHCQPLKIVNISPSQEFFVISRFFMAFKWTTVDEKFISIVPQTVCKHSARSFAKLFSSLSKNVRKIMCSNSTLWYFFFVQAEKISTLKIKL